jgi:hypothetical protein
MPSSDLLSCCLYPPLMPIPYRRPCASHGLLIYLAPSCSNTGSVCEEEVGVYETFTVCMHHLIRQLVVAVPRLVLYS